jgi:hypothetical protein
VGRKVLLVTVAFPVAISRFLYWGLQAAGAEVTVVGPCTGTFLPWHGGIHVAREYVWTPDLMLPGNTELQQKPLTIAEVCENLGRSDFDLVIQTDTEYQLAGPTPCKVVCFAVDNHVRDYKQREWDLIFGGHSWGYRSQEPIFRWTPCAYDPQWHFDKGLERPIDVAIVGVLMPNGETYKNRMEGVSALISNGISVVASTGKVYYDYNNIYGVAKIALCASSRGDLACRIFENMAQGCLILTDRVADLHKLGFVEDVHYLGWSSYPELVVQAKKGLNTELRERIVAAAKEKVYPHQWKARAEYILKECGL